MSVHRLLLCTLVALSPPAGRAATPFDDKAADALVEKAIKAFDAPGVAVAVVRGDEIVYLKGFGVKQLGEKSPVTPDSVFAIASCSKAFGTTLAAMLVDEGVMKWDDPVRKHLPTFRLSDALADKEVTIRDLFCHRSGMPRHDALWADTVETAEDVVSRYGRARPSTSFRSTWEYANIPFIAAGLAVGRVQGKPWHDLVRERIFEPLGMKSASCSVAQARKADDHATPHYRDADGKPQVDEWTGLDHVRAAGGINASARDMAQWVRLQLGSGTFEGKKLVSPEALRETHTTQMAVRREGRWRTFFPDKATDHLGYGLGWFVSDHRGLFLVSHGGTLAGFRAQVLLAPKAKCGVVALVNRGGTFTPEAVSKGLLELAAGLPPEDWVSFYQEQEKKEQADLKRRKDKKEADRKKDTKPSRELAGFAGIYEEPAYGKVEIRTDNKGLTLERGERSLRLRHYHYDTFAGTVVAPETLRRRNPDLEEDVVFRTGADGEVESLTFLGQTFQRVKDKAKAAPR